MFLLILYFLWGLYVTQIEKECSGPDDDIDEDDDEDDEDDDDDDNNNDNDDDYNENNTFEDTLFVKHQQRTATNVLHLNWRSRRPYGFKDNHEYRRMITCG